MFDEQLDHIATVIELLLKTGLELNVENFPFSRYKDFLPSNLENIGVVEKKWYSYIENLIAKNKKNTSVKLGKNQRDIKIPSHSKTSWKIYENNLKKQGWTAETITNIRESSREVLSYLKFEIDNSGANKGLTYSFPCQDLSVSGHWHNNTGGIDRNAKNRSTLLWQIERILKEYNASEKELPSFLLMENVSNILSARHIDNFNEWSSFLKNLGYVNQIYTLDARNFGIPQSRKRTFMLSVLANNKEKENLILNYFSENNLEKYQKVSIKPIENFLKLDYSIEKYKIEALESTPVLTESRKKIFEENPILAIGKKSVKNMVAKTITTKQDRHPNSGVVAYDSRTILTSSNILYRNLTPRECFLLMGFDEDQFDRLVESNFETKKGYRFLSTSKLLKMAGNSIVVPVLEEIFKQVIEIENLLKN